MASLHLWAVAVLISVALGGVLELEGTGSKIEMNNAVVVATCPDASELPQVISADSNTFTVGQSDSVIRVHLTGLPITCANQPLSKPCVEIATNAPRAKLFTCKLTGGGLASPITTSAVHATLEVSRTSMGEFLEATPAVDCPVGLIDASSLPAGGNLTLTVEFNSVHITGATLPDVGYSFLNPPPMAPPPALPVVPNPPPPWPPARAFTTLADLTTAIGEWTNYGASPPAGEPPDNWDVSQIDSFANAFMDSDFNEPIGKWDVTGVASDKVSVSHTQMFVRSKFNQDINGWDVNGWGGGSSDFGSMFENMPEFNQPLDKWNMPDTIAYIYYMFKNSPKFNQDLCSWKDKIDGYASTTSKSTMFDGSTPMSWPTCWA